MSSLDTQELAIHEFFVTLFGSASAPKNPELFLAVARRPKGTKEMIHEFYRFPSQVEAASAWVVSHRAANDMYFCVGLLARPVRKLDSAVECHFVWADLDTAEPFDLEPTPNFAVQSSPGRWHGYWKLNEPVAADIAADISKRIANKYSPLGVDNAQNANRLLRVPYTYNYKNADPQEVTFLSLFAREHTVEDFDAIEYAPGQTKPDNIAMPDEDDLPDAVTVYANHPDLRSSPFIKHLMEDTFDDDQDWSTLLFRLNSTLFERGLSTEEVFVLARESGVNKYARDGRPASELWRDVLKAKAKQAAKALHVIPHELPTFVTDEQIPTYSSIIDEYADWCEKQTDAPRAYHEAGAFILLSALLSETIRIDSSIGKILPNLWVMLLADTTLTRKTTALDLMEDVLTQVIEDPILATDGSVEGIMQGLSMRRRKPSVFKRDEFTGLLDQMNSRDYLSGMLEAFTKLYDGKMLKRVLKKETIEVRDPIFLMFTGGIKSRMQSLLTDHHIESGFIPRFIVITANTDPDRIKPLGPRTNESREELDGIIAKLMALKNMYVDPIVVNMPTGAVALEAPEVMAHLSPDAWAAYNKIEKDLTAFGLAADKPQNYTPVFDRMAKSLLKMAALLSASRQVLGDDRTFTVEVEDIYMAAKYIQKWAPCTLEILQSVGRTAFERNVEIVYRYAQMHRGVNRGVIMRNFKISAMEMDNIERTLTQRNMLSVEKDGKGSKYFAIEY